ncbi:MAG: SpvB/TcaC N-terminal domain-containing protein, partial [bacterium]|nr:SpvB/TcaC N-terminal domain-containing protein [bacterium]
MYIKNKEAQKWLIGTLIASIVFSPLTPAFAQSSDAPVSEAPAVTTDTPSTGDALVDPNIVSVPDATQESPMESAVGPDSALITNPDASLETTLDPTIPLAAGADEPIDEASDAEKLPEETTPPPPDSMDSGESNGPDIQPTVYSSFNQDQVKIDQNTGALGTTYPIVIPPGRNRVEPTLNLVYNSQNGQQGSIFGEGWSISIPYIERLNINGVENLYSSSTTNYFTSSLDGQLASTTVQGNFVARTENGSFNKYTLSSTTNSWTVTDKNGTQYTFGSVSSSQQNDPNNGVNVFKWMLDRVTDTNDNTVIYSYFKDSGQIYPSSTIYTGSGSSTGIFEVDFSLATSTDNATSSATGFAVKSNYRVSEINARVNGTWVRRYVLGYSTGDNGYTSLLGTITASGANSSGTVVTLPVSTFSYQTQTAGWTSSSTWNPPTPFVGGGGADFGVRIADVNSDALPDIVSSSPAWVNNGHGWTSSSTWNSPTPFTSGGSDSGARMADLNGDGLTDVISGSGAWINNGSGWTSSSTWTSPMSFVSSSVSNGTIIADVNGDGLPDIISGFTDGTSTTYAAWTNNGHGWTNNSSTWNPPISFVA